MKLSSKSQLGFVYGRLLILYSELWDHNLFKKMWKFTRNVRLHEQNKYRATSGVGSKKNLNRFHLGFAWTFYMIKAVRLSNNSRASDGFFFNRNFLDLKLLLLPNIRDRGVFSKTKICTYVENRPPFIFIFCSKLSGLTFNSYCFFLNKNYHSIFC